MTNKTANEPTPTGPISSDPVVVLVIPRRPVMISLFLVVLLGVGLLLGTLASQVFTGTSQLDADDQSGVVEPPPVTFIPPTSETRAVNGRFSVSPDDDPALGPDDAAVVIIEFSDYQCYFCGLFARETLPLLLTLYGDQIRFVYRDLVAYGPLSFQAALSAECANEQGVFWSYHDRLFQEQDNLGSGLFFALAEEFDLDMQEFARCVSDPAAEDEVKADTADGRALGIMGTPTFFINGRILIGAQPLSAFAAIIDEELNHAAPNKPADTIQDTLDGP